MLKTFLTEESVECLEEQGEILQEGRSNGNWNYKKKTEISVTLLLKHLATQDK